MLIDTSARAIWNQCHDIVFAGVCLLLAGLLAFTCSSGCGNRPDPTMPGSIALAWTITELDGRQATCAQVHAQSVTLRLRNHAGGVIVAAFPCVDSPSIAPLAAGVYDVTIDLETADGGQLATVPDQSDVTIVSGQVKRLTSVTFSASTQSRLVISLTTPATTNCQPAGMNGAGITGTTITLEKAASGCAAVTFIRSLGTTPRGTYTVNCSSPSVASCVEKNETLTTSLAAGTYKIRVRGRIGAVDCWQRDETLEVPPPGRPLIRTLDLTHQNLPDC